MGLTVFVLQRHSRRYGLARHTGLGERKGGGGHKADGCLVPLMDDYIRETGEFAALWPTSRHLSPRIGAFVNFLAERLRFDMSEVALVR